MTTTSEIAATGIIWILTAAGVFFGSRAAWRRRKQQREKAAQESKGQGDCHD
jgi:hypothetical protein